MQKIFYLFTLLLWSSITMATQPTPPKVLINSVIRGNTIYFTLRNKERFDLEITMKAGPNSSIQFKEMTSALKVNETVQLQADFKEAQGLQVLNVTSQVKSQRIGVIPGPEYYQAYRIIPTGAEKLTYSQAFLNQRKFFRGKSIPARINLGGVYYSAGVNPRYFSSKVTPPNSSIDPIKADSPLVYAKMKLRQLPRSIELSEGQRIENANIEDLLKPEIEQQLEAFQQEDVEMEMGPMALTTFRGALSLKIDDTTYKSAWGWVVRVWQYSSGAWRFRGWAYVGGDGRWQVQTTAAVAGQPTWIEYQTKNRFVSLQDPAGNPYTWGDSWTLTGTTLDVGSRYADLTVTGDLPGVDKLYVGATNVWVKFYNNGINALRDQPIRVYYPNSLASGGCIYDDGSGPYAWSCSYWGDGRIYIIPAHASASVVQHEIAHSINSFYWSGVMPPGSGGTHNLWNCYNPGLALTEGWANFVAYWVQFDRNETNPVAPNFGGMNIETIPSGVCANQNGEMRVAATFWDTYDYWNDGPDAASSYDSLLYTNQGVPVSIYLGNKRNSAAAYLPVMQSGQSTYWQNEFTKLFRLNKIVP